MFFGKCWSKELYEITLATSELKRLREVDKILCFGKKLKIKCESFLRTAAVKNI